MGLLGQSPFLALSWCLLEKYLSPTPKPSLLFFSLTLPTVGVVLIAKHMRRFAMKPKESRPCSLCGKHTHQKSGVCLACLGSLKSTALFQQEGCEWC
jgi:hypothetical protein